METEYKMNLFLPFCRCAQQIEIENDHERLTALLGNVLDYVKVSYIKILVVRPSVTDVGVAVTNLLVVFKIITCISAFTKISFLRYSQSCY